MSIKMRTTTDQSKPAQPPTKLLFVVALVYVTALFSLKMSADLSAAAGSRRTSRIKQPEGTMNTSLQMTGATVLRKPSHTNTAPSTIQQISLLGERNSGTRWTYAHLSECFDHKLRVERFLTRYKHWFQDPTSKLHPLKRETLVIAQFRNPYDWLKAMQDRPHHAPNHLDVPWKEFLKMPWNMERIGSELNITSIETECQHGFKFNQINSCVKMPLPREFYQNLSRPFRLSRQNPLYELKQDGSGEPFASIIDLRTAKIKNFLETKNYPRVADTWPVQYEYLLAKGTKEMLERISEITGVPYTCDPLPVQATRRKRELPPEYMDYVTEHVDWETEKLIGYHRRDSQGVDDKGHVSPNALLLSKPEITWNVKTGQERDFEKKRGGAAAKDKKQHPTTDGKGQNEKKPVITPTNKSNVQMAGAAMLRKAPSTTAQAGAASTTADKGAASTMTQAGTVSNATDTGTPSTMTPAGTASPTAKTRAASMTSEADTTLTTTYSGIASKTTVSSHFKSNATIITAFYQGPCRHPMSKYEAWSKKLFSLQDPIIIFTTPSFAPFVQEQRDLHNAMHKTKIVLLDLNKTDTVNMFDLDFWKEQHAKDPKKKRNKSYHVYWVWLSKFEFVRRAIAMNPFQSEFFAWVDVGYFRTKTWVGKKLLQHIPNALHEDQILMLDHHHNSQVGAGFIGGYSKGLLRYDKIFYDHLKKRQHTAFIGREEPMLDEACLVEQSLCLLATPGKKYEDQWLYMAPFLILGQKETESLVYVPTVATDKVQRDMVNSLNIIKPPDEPRNVLMVVAHPDDEVLWGGEYLLKEGQNVHVVVTSTLNRGTSTRYDEFRAVQEHLGYHGEFLDGKDSPKISETGLESHIQQRIQTLVCGKYWEKIITHGPEGEYGHPHNQMVHDAVLDAVRMCCYSSEKLFVFEPHPSENHVFSGAKQTVAKLYKSQEKVIFQKFGNWREQIVPFEEYDYKAASRSCRDSRDPTKKAYTYRQCRLHEMFNFSSSKLTSALSMETYSGQGSGC